MHARWSAPCTVTSVSGRVERAGSSGHATRLKGVSVGLHINLVMLVLEYTGSIKKIHPIRGLLDTLAQPVGVKSKVIGQ